jgi:hypothetical protein
MLRSTLLSNDTALGYKPWRRKLTPRFTPDGGVTAH